MPPRPRAAVRRPARPRLPIRTSRAPRTPVLPLVAVFAAGYLAGYLLPTIVGRLTTGLTLTTTQSGAVGSALLLASAGAGFVLASRVERIGPKRLARTGLLLAAGGFAVAAYSVCVPLVVAGSVVGGFGSGTVTAVAAVGIAGRPDAHRASVLGLLATSTAASGLYLVLPRLGGGHQLPFAALACITAGVLPAVSRLPSARRAESRGLVAAGRLPRRGCGTVLAGATLCWSLVQNALWTVSGRIGLDRVGLSEAALGVIFALALGGGLAGVVGAGALGSRLGRAAPVGAGTAVIALCVAMSSAARSALPFTAGEVLWNTVYPLVFTHLIGVAAALDARGRWVVLAGSASSLGVAGGPLTGTLLSLHAGYPVMGVVLGTALLLVAVPLTAVALRAGGRVPLPRTVRRREGTAVPAAEGAAGVPGAALQGRGATEHRVLAAPSVPGAGVGEPTVAPADAPDAGAAAPAARPTLETAAGAPPTGLVGA